MQNNSKTTILIILGFLVFILFGFYFKISNKKENKSNVTINKSIQHATVLPTPKQLTSIDLITTKDIPLIKQMEDKWSVIFFGYTSCPHLCPKTTKLMASIMEQSNLNKTQFIFVTIDPKKDNQNHLIQYLENYDSRIIGATGELPNILAMVKELNLYVANSDPNKVHHVDHSGSLVLVSPELKFTAIFANPSDHIAIAKEIRIIQST